MLAATRYVSDLDHLVIPNARHSPAGPAADTVSLVAVYADGKGMLVNPRIAVTRGEFPRSVLLLPNLHDL